MTFLLFVYYFYYVLKIPRITISNCKSSCNNDEKPLFETIVHITIELSVNEAISEQLLEATIIG